ncbi:MAG: PPC domain-containing protein [Plesiomonas shigelloides]
MILKTMLKVTLLFACVTTTAFAAGISTDVQFAKGHDSAQYTGHIKGYDYDSYFFRAKKGQLVHIAMANETPDLVLFGPGIDDSVSLGKYSPDLDDNGQYTLPASGRYELRVLQSRAEARRNKTQNYKFQIQIK